MTTTKKISYKDDFSDSDSTIIDSDIGDFVTQNDGIQASTSYLLDTFYQKQNDDELNAILKKYSNFSSNPSATSHASKTEDYNTIELSSDEDLPCVQAVPSHSKKENRKEYINVFETACSYDVDESDSISDSKNDKASIKSRKRDRQTALDKKEKKKEKIRKQEEAAKEKRMKQALASANRNMKPENCMKVVETAEDNETDEAILIMDWKEVINLVNEKTLVSRIETIKQAINKSKLFILIYEIENYFKYCKRYKLNSDKINNKKDKVYGDVPKISRMEVEAMLTELQVLHSCCHQFVETPQIVGKMVGHFTKSIALLPYKMEMYKKQQETDWFLSGDNRDCVKVDKNGNGLRRLWQQQLTTFQLARLEHAEAIVTKYPTLHSLLEECSTSDEKVVQDLPIRRAAGPLTTVRRIGPELSKTIYTYFTSIEGELKI
ncbi:hypothetical protein FQR65_LT01062 [Abscondita terminalis]|nr:hypothetical protein FQR65_LT01062 [Abscondita terminalis]